MTDCGKIAVKDLWLKYQAILAGNDIGDLDKIEDRIAKRCKIENVDVLDVLTNIELDLYEVSNVY